MFYYKIILDRGRRGVMKEKQDGQEEIEMLDFEADEKVASEIEEMLDFIDISQDAPEILEEENELDELLETATNETSVKIDVPDEKLDEYLPSIKDFNIKNAKTRKIVKKVMLYVVIIMLLGFEFFISKTGDILNNLRVYASDNQPIRIIQNEKYGYIDYTGNKVVNPKYTYGEDFIKGYAIVKNSSNLPLIIDKGGKEAVKTGEYFSIYRAEDNIIASKVTKKGLKYGVLNADLREIIPFKYDSISYLGEVYSYTDGNNIGLINRNGKVIYTFKVATSADKTIEVKASSITGKSTTQYGVVKVNGSSQIINLTDGSVVSSPTLNDVTPEENNVFYETLSSGNKRYLYVQDNKVLVESDDYTSLSIDSISAGVLKAITNSYTYEFISTKSLERLQKNLALEDTYEGDNVFMYNLHNYRKNTNSIVMVKNGEVFKTLEDEFTIYKGFKNGIAIVKFKDNTYGYLNEDGTLINADHYLEAGEFDGYGEAIARKDTGYGVVRKDGKYVISFDNQEIKMVSSKVKKRAVSDDKNIFYAVKKDSRYGLYNKDGKKVNKSYYNEVEFNQDYPIIKVSTDLNDLIIMVPKMSEIPITSYNTLYQAYDNYIILKNEYYNYNGKLIYVDNGKGESDGEKL